MAKLQEQPTEQQQTDMESITRELARTLVPHRETGAHKWGVGGVVLIAGSPGYTGAAILSAMSAARSGAGIVTLAATRGVAASVVTNVPETTTVMLPDFDPADGRKQLEPLLERIEKSGSILVGPGLGDDESADSLLAALFGAPKGRSGIGFGASRENTGGDIGGGLLAKTGKPLVVDADALNWLAKQADWPALLPGHGVVLTPHVGEMARLLGRDSNDLIADPVATAQELAEKSRQTVVFKYGCVVIASHDRLLQAEDAPVSLATAGSGDVLAGSIAAFLAQGLDPVAAATLAVYLGARAARRVEAFTGVLGLVASDLPLAIAGEIGDLEREREQASE